METFYWPRLHCSLCRGQKRVRVSVYVSVLNSLLLNLLPLTHLPQLQAALHLCVCARVAQFPRRQVSEWGGVQMHAEHNSLKGLLFRLESAHRLSELCVCPSALFGEREKDISAFSSSSNKALRLLTSTPLLVVLFSLPSQNVLRLCAVVALLHGRKRKRNSFTFFNTCHWVSYICVALKWLQ